MARMNHRQFRTGMLPVFICLVLISALLTACANNEQLFAEYRSDFCVAPASLHADAKLSNGNSAENIRTLQGSASSRLKNWEPAVYFDSDEYLLTEDARDTLDTNIDFLLAFPTNRVSIRGFTDQHAANEYNQRLSKRRAESVVTYLSDEGINRSRMVVHALGESIAMPSEGLPAADETSRRVEMVLLDKSGWPARILKSLTPGTGE